MELFAESYFYFYQNAKLTYMYIAVFVIFVPHKQLICKYALLFFLHF